MHLKGLQTVALPKHPHTRVMAIDIDKRNNSKVSMQSIVDRLVNDLGQPFFLEHSSTTGGYHVYWYYKEYVREDFWQTYTHKLKEIDMIIEPVIGKKNLRLPYSSTYRRAGTYNSVNRSRVESVSSIDEVLSIFREKEEISITPYMRKIIRDLPLQGDIARIDREINPSLSQKSPQDLIPSLGYGFGTRHISQPKIAFYVLRRYGDDFSKFDQLCRFFNDGTSKDMQNPEYVIQRILSNIWSWASTHFSGDLPTKGVDSKEVKPSRVVVNSNYSLSNFDRNAVRYVINHVYTNMHFGVKLHGRTHDRTVSDAVKLFEILYNKQRYHEDTDAKYQDERLTNFNHAVNLDSELRDKIASEYGLKNPRRLIRILMASGLIELQRTSEGYAWSYKQLRYCKHYKIATNPNNYLKSYLRKLHTSNSPYTSIYTYNRYSTYGGHGKHKLYQKVLLDLGGEHLIDRLRRLQKLRLKRQVSYGLP